MTVTIENTYTGNNSTTDYSFTFPYLDTTDIKVSLNGVATTAYSLLNATTVRFDSAPGTGVAIRIYRETAYSNPKATFYPGSAIRAGDLNDNTLQNLYVTQEANDKVANAWLTGDPTVISTESWYTTDDTKIASTKAIENRINSQIDSALTDDVIAGNSISIADDTPSSGKITISVNAATTSASGSMSAADKSKLDGIEANATADQTNAEIRAAVEAATDSNVFTDADHSKLNAIEASATADQTDAEIRAAVEAASDSNVFTDADHTKLNGIEASATADQTAAEIKTAYESNAQTNPLTDAEKAVIDGVTANTSELNKLDGVTATTTQLNIVSGKTFRASSDGTLSTTSDTEIPSSKVIASHVASAVSNVGGFVTIANEISFPTTANQPANGVIVSISDAAGTVINGSGVSTTGRTTDGTPATVTINNFPSSLQSETLASGVALLVTSTGSSNTYNYHKILAAETDVKSLSDDINDFNARYRVAGSAPGSNNDDGDLWFDTTANKMKVYNATGSSWDDVASVGQFFINTLSSSGSASDTIPGGSATFNGTAKKFTLSNPATGGAQQLLVSVNGVLQKPNSGSSVPSEGFAISGNDIIFSTAPASGSDYFIVTQGSSVSIGTPSANSVNSSHIIDGSIVNADVSNSADIAGSKVADDSIPEAKLDVHNAPATGKYLKYTSNGMEWADGASEGTDVKSTGESGTTKFLRVDGDGTCSWQVPSYYTHPNHSGEVTSTGDGATVIASDVVDEDNLKISNAGTNGQYLQKQSGNTGGLTWADVTIPPAGNTFTAVADGAIANNKPLLLLSNGKVTEGKETITQNTNPSQASSNSVGHNDSREHQMVKMDGNYYLYTFKNGNQGDKCYSHVATYDPDTLTFSSNGTEPVQTTAGAAAYTCPVWDSNVNKALCVWQLGGPLYYSVGTRSGADMTWGTQTMLEDTSGNNKYKCVNGCFDPDTNTCIFVFQGSGTTLQNKTFTKCGTIASDGSVTWGSKQEVQALSPTDHYGVDIEYDTGINRAIVVLSYKSDATGTDKSKFESRVGTVSNSNTISWGTAYTLDYHTTMYYKAPKIAIDPDTQKYCVITQNSNDANLYAWALTGAGSSTNTITHHDGLPQQVGSDSDIGVYMVQFDPATDRMVVCYRKNSNNRPQATFGTWTDNYSSTNDKWTWSTTTEMNTNDVRGGGSVDVVGANGSDDGMTNGAIVPGGGAVIFHYFHGQNKFDVYKTQTSTTNLTNAEHYVGFADAAYSDGQTVTVKTQGNVVTTLSGLTIFSNYYMLNTGAVSATPWGSVSCNIGRAIATDKLQINTNYM